MSVNRQLVTGFLEMVSWRVLEECRDEIKALIKGKPGLYALYRGDHLYYVGLASNLMRRLNRHLKDRHGGAWDRFSIYLTGHDEHIKELETLVLRIANPSGNRVAGRFADARDLKRVLHKSIKERQSDTNAELLGGHVAKRKRRKKAKGHSIPRPLAGLVPRRMSLKGFRGGYEYRASLLKNGTIRYGGHTYDHPTEAASAALPANDRKVNGWAFWRYKDRDTGEWVRLSKLKNGKPGKSPPL